MRIGFDLDGVLVGFERGFAPLFPFPMPVDSPEFPPVWHYPQHYGATEGQVNEAWEQIRADERFWVTLPPLRPTTYREVRSLNELRRRGHDIYFITNRVGKRCKEQSEQWLINHGFFNPTVIVTSRKGSIVRDIGLDGYIDDKPSNCEDVRKTAPKCRTYVMDRPYNQEFTHPVVRRVASVEEMLSNELERSGLLPGELAFSAEGAHARYRV